MRSIPRIAVTALITGGLLLVPAAPASAAPDIGALTAAGCISDVGFPVSCATTQQGLDVPTSVVTSPDGTSVYVAAGEGAVVRFDRDTTTGALTGAGCISDTEASIGCSATQQGLGTARSVTVSPDGTSVYAVSDDDAIVHFERNTATGALVGMGCVTDVESATDCAADAQGLDGAFAVAVSRDGRSVYVASTADDAVVRFDRDTATGALTGGGCISDVESPTDCATDAQGLNGARSVVVSPDGVSVYTVANEDGAITRFDRDPGSGALTGAGCVAGVGSPIGCAGSQAGLPNAQNVAVSPDGRSVYVAATATDAVISFDRSTSSGALTPAGCITDVGSSTACADAEQGLNGARGVTVSPDGASVYVTSGDDNAVVRFRRSPTTGALTGAGCLADVASDACGADTAEGLQTARSVTVSPDGRSAYVVGAADAAIVRFDRVPDTSNHSLIRIPGSGTQGDAGPSPSSIEVSDLETKIADVDVTLHGLSHAFPADVAVLLEGPSGSEVLLLADAGGSTAVSDLDLTFDDSAPDVVPLTTPVSGTYRPTNHSGSGLGTFGDLACNPGPGGAAPQTGCLATAFRGTDPNGEWDLYLLDDTAGDVGSLARGWSLEITTDVVAPQTTITSGPGPATNDTTPTFGFSADDPDASFQCRVDTNPFTSCTTPYTTSALAAGAHTFEVRATDLLDNTDPTPGSLAFEVDLTAPETTIDSGPSATTTNPNVTFAFSSTDAGASFACSLDATPFDSCASPTSYLSLADGPHTFAVRATDPAGNIDADPAVIAFTVARPPPPDTTVNGTAAATAKQRNTKPKIAVQVTTGEGVTIRASGVLKLGQASYPLKPLTRAVGAGSTGLKLKPAKGSDAGTLAAALADGKKLKATIIVVLTDAVGNTTTQKLKVTLRE